MSEVSASTSARFGNLKFIAAILVVMLHVVNAMPKEGPSFASGFIMHGLCAVAVPFFFFAAGYFLSLKFSRSGWWGTAVERRVGSLLVPYVAFNMVCWIATDPFSFGGVKEPFGFPLCMPLYNVTWFLRALFLFVLVSPLVEWGSRSRKKFGVFVGCIIAIIVALAGLSVSSEVHEMLTYGFPLYGFLYFTFGCYAGRNGMQLKPVGGIVPWLCGIVSILIMCWCVTHDRLAYIVISYPLLLILLWRLVPARPFPKWLTSATCAIYLLHPAMIFAVSKVLSRKHSLDFILSSYWGAVLLIVAIVVISVLISNLVGRKLPLVSRIFFGGR